MPVQDLTPQLRTRLSRVERAVGVFVIVATLLLLAGFAFYLYSTAQRKGWLKKKFNYHAFVATAVGIKEGDQVLLHGFSAGRVTEVEAMPPFSDWGNVYVQFEVIEPYQDYIWDDSRVKVVAIGLLGQRGLELVAGGSSGRTNLQASYEVDRDKKGRVSAVKGVLNDKTGKYEPVSAHPKGYPLNLDESPAVTERAEKLVAQIEAFLPNLTNQIGRLLSNLNSVTERADDVLANAQPILTNAAAITANLKDPNGSLGKWVLTPHLMDQIDETIGNLNITLTNANQTISQTKATIANTDSNVTKLATSLDQTLINLADLTSNLNAQVQMNTNLVSNINTIIINADDMIQGLKRHWLLRSAFKEKKSKEEKKSTPIRPPK